MTDKQYPPLPEPFHTSAYLVVSKTRSRTGERRMYSGSQMRAYVDADRAQRLTIQAENNSRGGVDWLGLALDLDSSSRKVESQTACRAMLNAAYGLRLMGREANNPSRPDAGNTQE